MNDSRSLRSKQSPFVRRCARMHWSSATTADRASPVPAVGRPIHASASTRRSRCATAQVTRRRRGRGSEPVERSLLLALKCMHAIEPARLKPGVSTRVVAGDPTPKSEARSARGWVDYGPGAHLLGSEEPAGDEVRQETRRDRYRPDHAGRRLCVGEPRNARRAMEGGIVSLPDAGFPRARPSRRELRHRWRPLRDRLLAGDEPRRASRASPRRPGCRWSSSAARTWATSSAATASTSACTSSRARRRLPTRRTATS